MQATDDTLWTPRELARYLGYSESTITRMVSQEPEKLPPRVAALARPRWLPSAAHEWVKSSTETNIGRTRRLGRPRAR